jgi:uncharacterized protein (TIGR02421 family)
MLEHTHDAAALDGVIGAVRDRLSRNLPIRRTLPGDGRLRIGRQLPFLCVYRAPRSGRDNGTRELVTTEAAYLLANGEPQYAAGVERLCRTIGETLEEHFGALLLIEVWAEEDRPPAELSRHPAVPRFRIAAGNRPWLSSTLTALEAGLGAVRLFGQAAEVELVHEASPAPPGLPPLADGDDGSVYLGIGVRPVYRDRGSGALYPLTLQSLRRQLAVALRKCIFTFTGREAPPPYAHYEALGPSAVSKDARLADQQLCEVSQSFDFLLQTTPVNAEAAWVEFENRGRRLPPVLYYRPLPYHPTLLKRQLYAIAIERIEDSTLALLMEQKQEELGIQLAALQHIGTPKFLYESLELYGKPEPELTALADDILTGVECDDPDAGSATLGSAAVADAARDEIDFYHQHLPAFNASVETTGAIVSALMVAQERLLISESAAVRPERLEALVHHEVSVHLLTYFNGRQQPLRLLYAGLPGYEALQEGLAVLTEYLVGGLSRSRLRTVAARVAAVASVAQGASFLEAFDLLHHQRNIPAKTAFMTVLRSYRGGGLTKDALYLRGLRDVLAYLAKGHDLEPLFVGKISLEHAPVVQEMRRRGLVQPPALLPRFWGESATLERLERCRSATVIDLVEDC